MVSDRLSQRILERTFLLGATLLGGDLLQVGANRVYRLHVESLGGYLEEFGQERHDLRVLLQTQTQHDIPQSQHKQRPGHTSTSLCFIFMS